jgi:hypothetical protein
MWRKTVVPSPVLGICLGYAVHWILTRKHRRFGTGFYGANSGLYVPAVRLVLPHSPASNTFHSTLETKSTESTHTQGQSPTAGIRGPLSLWGNQSILQLLTDGLMPVLRHTGSEGPEEMEHIKQHESYLGYVHFSEPQNLGFKAKLT